MGNEDSIWREWYAWHPVWPADNGVAWLEVVWRRRNPMGGHWQYRTFRPDCDKSREDQDREKTGRSSW